MSGCPSATVFHLNFVKIFQVSGLGQSSPYCDASLSPYTCWINPIPGSWMKISPSSIKPLLFFHELTAKSQIRATWIMISKLSFMTNLVPFSTFVLTYFAITFCFAGYSAEGNRYPGLGCSIYHHRRKTVLGKSFLLINLC